MTVPSDSVELTGVIQARLRSAMKGEGTAHEKRMFSDKAVALICDGDMRSMADGLMWGDKNEKVKKLLLRLAEDESNGLRTVHVEQVFGVHFLDHPLRQVTGQTGNRSIEAHATHPSQDWPL